MSKIEGNIDVGKLEKSDNFREYLLRSIDKNLKYMEEKDFLKKQSYPQESKVNKRFQEYIGILKQLQQIIKSGEYTKLSDTLQGIRKGFY